MVWLKKCIVTPARKLTGNHFQRPSKNALKTMDVTSFMIAAEMEMNTNIVLMVRRQRAPDVALFCTRQVIVEICTCPVDN